MADQIQTNPLFVQLIFSFQASAMQQLGKIMNPVTQKVEKHLEGARYTIDLLMALRDKTEGNCSQDEKSLLNRMIYELQMNYADEVELEKKQATDDAETKTETETAEEESTDEKNKENDSEKEQ